MSVRIHFVFTFRIVFCVHTYDPDAFCIVSCVDARHVSHRVMCSYDFYVSVFSYSFRIHVSHRVVWTHDLYALQHPATHCNTLQRTATHTATHCNTCFASCRMNTRPVCTATPCNTLQHTATHCSAHRHTLQHTFRIVSCVHMTRMNTKRHGTRKKTLKRHLLASIFSYSYGLSFHMETHHIMGFSCILFSYAYIRFIWFHMRIYASFDFI